MIEVRGTWQGWEITIGGETICVARTKDGAKGLIKLYERGALRMPQSNGMRSA